MESVRVRIWLLTAPLVAVAALLQARAVSALVSVVLEPDAEELAAVPPSARAGDERSPSPASRHPSAHAVLARNPFDHITGPLETAPGTHGENGSADEDDIPSGDPWTAPTCENVDVFAIAASDDPAWSFAALAGTDGKAALHRRGDAIGNEKVTFVGGDRVWLSHGGELCQVKLHEGKKHTQAAPAKPPPAASTTPSRGGSRGVDPAIKKGIRKISDTSFEIDRGVVDQILENQAVLMRQARIVPEQENGRVVGIRLLGVRADSLLSTLGMQNGDRLQTINGFEMASPEKALEAYARLRTADKLTISLVRGGKAMNLDYDIR
jgi:general secretion pathway protein C